MRKIFLIICVLFWGLHSFSSMNSIGSGTNASLSMEILDNGVPPTAAIGDFYGVFNIGSDSMDINYAKNSFKINKGRLYLMSNLQGFKNPVIIGAAITVRIVHIPTGKYVTKTYTLTSVSGAQMFEKENGIDLKDGVLPPQAGISVSNKEYCAGTKNNTLTATVTNPPTGYPTGYRINWGDPLITTKGALTATGGTANIPDNYAGATALTPKLEKTDSSQVVAATAPYAIKVNALPTVTNLKEANSKTDVCTGTVSMTASGSGGTGALQYSWNGGTYGAAGTNTGSVTYNTAGNTQKFTVKVKDTKGCESTEASVNLNVHKVVVTPPATFSVAHNTSATLAATVVYTPTGGAASPENVVWTPVASIESDGDKLSATTKPLTTATTFTVKVTDKYTCSDSKTVLVSVGAAGPELAGTPTGGTLCADGVATLTLKSNATGGVGSDYSATAWTVKSGNAADIQLGAVATNGNVTVGATSKAGTYTLSVAISDGTTTLAAKDVIVTINAKPTLTTPVATPNTINSGQTSTLTTTVTPNMTCTWSGGPLPTPPTGTTVTTPALTETTTYTVTAGVTGCADTKTVLVTVNGVTPPTGTANLALTVNTVCQGAANPLKLTMAPQGASTYSFQLLDAGGIAVLTVNNEPVPASGHWEHVVIPTAQGNYRIFGFTAFKDGVEFPANKVTVTPAGGQVNASYATLPVVRAIADGSTTKTVCSNEFLTLTGSGDAVTYVWDNGIGNGVAFKPTDGMTYTVTGTNLLGCTNTASVQVTTTPAPIVQIEPLANAEICLGGQVTLVTTFGSNADTYVWEPTVPAGGVVSPIMTTKYKVTGTIIATGCKDTATVVVKVNMKPEIVATSKNPRTIAIGKNADFSVTADRAETYKWEYRKNVTDEWALLSDMPASQSTPLIEGSTTAKIMLTKVPRNWDNIELRCTAENPCGPADTTFRLFVKECFEVLGALEMGEGIQPDEVASDEIDGWYCMGTKIVLNAVITPEDSANAIEKPRYTWMIDGEPANKVIKSDSSTLSWVPEFWEDDIVVKVGVYSDGACDTVYTKYLRLKARKIEDVSVNILTSVVPDTLFCLNEVVDFTVAPKNAGKNPTYTWTNNGFDMGTGANKSLTMMEATWVKVIMTPSKEVCAGEGIIADTIHMVQKKDAKPTLEVTNSIGDTMACPGDVITFTAVYEGAGLEPSFYWQKDVWNLGRTPVVTTKLDDNKDIWVKCEMYPSKDVCYSGDTLVVYMPIRLLEDSKVTIFCDMDNKKPGDELTFTSVLEHMPVSPIYEWFINGNLSSEPSDTYISNVLRQNDMVALAVSGQKICQTRMFSNEIVVNFNKASRDTMVEIYMNEKVKKLNMFKVGDENSIFRIIEMPKYGKASMFKDGRFDYNPDKDFTGQDFVKYEVINIYDKTKVEEGYIYITVKDEGRYFIPNIITPNEDGLNDTWRLDFLAEYPEHILTVYNTASHIVFQAKNYQNDWNGKNQTKSGYVSQKNLNNGVYTYVIDLGNKVILKGWIEIRGGFSRGYYR